MGPNVSGVGVIDKAVAVLNAIEARPLALGDLVAETGLSRATAHRLASALEVHGLLRRDGDGRFTLGSRMLSLGRTAADGWPLAAAASTALAELRDVTGESAQLYVRDGDRRVCIASLESPHGLRTIVATGESLPIELGSGGRVLSGETGADGWLASVAERETGVASVSAPVSDAAGVVVAAVSVSGPIDRNNADPGPLHGPSVVAAASRIARDAWLT